MATHVKNGFYHADVCRTCDRIVIIQHTGGSTFFDPLRPRHLVHLSRIITNVAIPMTLQTCLSMYFLYSYTASISLKFRWIKEIPIFN